MSNGVQHKMLTYEVTPPSGVWNKIAAELDESELEHNFPSVLYNAEVTAPAAAWSKIQASIAAGYETAVPEKRKFSPFLRYAAAAVLIGLVAWAGLKLLNNPQKKNELADIRTTQPAKESTEPPAPPTEPVTINEQTVAVIDQAEEARNDAALEASKKTFAKLETSAKSRRLKNIAAAYRFASADATDETGADYVTGRNDTDVAGRYILMMTPDGHLIRMSKKLDNLVCCVSGEEQDKECNDQMTRWRQQMACSPTGHSTGSFLDIISLIKSLEDQ